jgi:hypothetical protein
MFDLSAPVLIPLKALQQMENTMSRTKKILLGTVAVVGIGGAAFAFSGVGGQSMNTAKLELISSAMAASDNSGGNHRYHRGGRHGGMRMICSDRRAEKVEDAIGFAEAFFSFNAEQKVAWDGLATALRDGSETIGKHCEAMKGDDKAKTATDKFARMETMLTAGLEVVQKVRPAFDKLYATLDAKQQAALDKMIQRRRGGRH